MALPITNCGGGRAAWLEAVATSLAAACHTALVDTNVMYSIAENDRWAGYPYAS